MLDIRCKKTCEAGDLLAEPVLSVFLPPQNLDGIAVRVLVTRVLLLAIEFRSDSRRAPIEIGIHRSEFVPELDLQLRWLEALKVDDSATSRLTEGIRQRCREADYPLKMAPAESRIKVFRVISQRLERDGTRVCATDRPIQRPDCFAEGDTTCDVESGSCDVGNPKFV
jgi:hypothetical protein